MNERELYRIRWAESWRMLRHLYRHPDDTTTIAKVIEAWQGRSMQRIVTRLRKRAKGRSLLARKPALRTVVRDIPWLESMPEGSLGRAYLDHCNEQKLGLAGMTDYVEEGTSSARVHHLPADEQFIEDYLFHSHDIFHLVAGYKTDLLGEVCLLAFSAGQTLNTGVFAMMFLGAYSIRLPRLRGQRLMLHAFFRGLRGRMNGRGWCAEQDWVELMPESLEAIQKRMGFWPPPAYQPVYIGAMRERREAAAAT